MCTQQVNAEGVKKTLREHSKTPCHHGSSRRAHLRYAGRNPLCGDELVLYIEVQQVLEEPRACRISVSFEGFACSVCRASTSLLLKNLHEQDPDSLALQSMLETHLKPPSQHQPRWHIDLSVDSPFTGLEQAAMEQLVTMSGRQKCVTLPWKTLHDAVAMLNSVMASGEIADLADVPELKSGAPASTEAQSSPP